MRVRRLANQARREGRVNAGEDVRVFEERRFYAGKGLRRNKEGGSETGSEV